MKRQLPTLFALTAVLTLGVSLYVNINTKAPTENIAAQVDTNFAPYTYSGDYYSSINFDAGDGMNGELRKALTSHIKPKGFVKYSSGLSEHLQEADEDQDNKSNMVLFYTRDSVKKHEATDWNREHVWPKSLSNGNWGTDEGGTDILHLRPTYNRPNSDRSSHPFGNAASGGDKMTYNNMDFGYLKGDIFEPLDCVKGDVARIIMYVWTTYDTYPGYSHLSITKVFESYDTLLTWHIQDQPDTLEGHRNDYVQNDTLQKNRNPFVDHPELAWKIFGDEASSTVKANCMAAYPGNGGVHIDPTGITLNKSTASVEVGRTVQLSASLQPTGASGTITWSSSNSAIASVSNGKVTGVAEGNATITATCGSYKATCEVTVTEAKPINYGSETNPITVEEAKAIIDQESPTKNKLYVKGIVSSNTYNTQYKNFDDVYLKDDTSDTALSVFRSVLGEGLDSSYNATGSMVGKEIVACGYGELYKGSKYELSKQNDYVPTILKIKDPSVIEKTPKEIIEEKTTSTSLAYNFSKESNGTSAVTDTLTRDDTTATGTTYVDWTHISDDSNVSYKGQSAGDKGTIQLRTKNSNSGIVTTANVDGKKVASVTVVWNSGTSSGRKLNVYGKNTAYTAATDLYNTGSQGTLLGTITYGTSASITITGDYMFIGVRSDDSALYLDSISIQWGGVATTYEYSNVCIRFGGVIEKDLWSKLDTEDHAIKGFGVVITDGDFAKTDSEFLETIGMAIPSTVSTDLSEHVAIDYFVPIENLSIIGETADSYFWNLRHSVTELDKEYAAAAYIKTATDCIYLKKVTYSAATLADDYIQNRGYQTSAADGSLGNLAKMK